jgi:hypothetical protein
MASNRPEQDYSSRSYVKVSDSVGSSNQFQNDHFHEHIHDEEPVERVGSLSKMVS